MNKKKQIKQWLAKEIYTSKRFCVNCNKKTKFKFNHIFRHSECSICGFRGKDK